MFRGTGIPFFAQTPIAMITRLPVWKTILMIFPLMISFCNASAQDIWWIATTDETWGNGTNWSTVGATGPACNCVPDANSHVIFTDQGPGNCRLDVSPTIKSVETNLYVGTIDLDGHNWTIAGTGGDISNLRDGVTISNTGAPATLDIAHDSNSAQVRFGAITVGAGVNVTCTAWQIYIANSVFNGSATFVATADDGNNDGSGNAHDATFNGPTSFTITNNTFNFMSGIGRSVFNNTLALNNLSQLPTSDVISCQDVDFNGDATLAINANFAQGIFFNNVVLAASAKLTTVPGTQGAIGINNSVFNGGVEIDLTENNNSSLNIDNSTFADDVRVSCGNLNIGYSTFAGTSDLTIKGVFGGVTYGNNFFQGPTSVTLNDQAGAFQMGVLAALGKDTFEGPLTITNLSTIGSPVVLGTDSDVTFDADVTFNSIGGSSPIIVVSSAGRSATYNGNVNFNAETPVIHNVETIFSGTVNQTISNTFPASIPSFQAVTVNKSSGDLIMSAGAAIQVSDAFTFTSGIVKTTATSLVLFLDGSSVGGAPDNSSHIDGPVSKEGNTPFDFPTGNNGIYGPIYVSPTGPVTLAAQFFRSSPYPGRGNTKGFGIEHLSECEHWTLDRTAGVTAVGVALSWTSANCPVTSDYIGDLNDLRVTRWDNVGAEWSDQGNGGTSGDVNSGTVTTAAPLSDLGAFTLGSSSDMNQLPIILLDFTGHADDATVALQWRTEKEVNNDYFEIEHAGADFLFHKIGQIMGAGISEDIVTYNFAHLTPSSGVNYYRLKQVDWDGKYTYSSAISIDFDGDKTMQMRPNPATQGDVVQFSKKVTGQVVNNMGTVVLELHDVDHFHAGQIPPGIYIIRCVGGESSKLIVH
jgi:hypothetical protein